MDEYKKWQLMQNRWHEMIYNLAFPVEDSVSLESLHEKLVSLAGKNLKVQNELLDSFFTVPMDHEYELKISYSEKAVSISLTISRKYIGLDKKAFSLKTDSPCEFLEYFFEHFDEMRNQAENAVLEEEKRLKIESMRHLTIEVLVKDQLEGSNYAYKLIKGEKTKHNFLEIKLSGKRKLRIMLSNTDFAKQISGIKTLINSIEAIENETGMKIRILNYGAKQEWDEER